LIAFRSGCMPAMLSDDSDDVVRVCGVCLYGWPLGRDVWESCRDEAVGVVVAVGRMGDAAGVKSAATI
jgi:hypothetical protein